MSRPGPRSQVTRHRGRDSKRDSASRTRPSISPWHTHRPLAAHRGQRKKKLLATAPAGLGPSSGRMQPGRPDSDSDSDSNFTAAAEAGMLSQPTRGGAQPSQVQSSPGPRPRPSGPESLAAPDRPGAPPRTRFWHPGEPSQSPPRPRTEPIHYIYTQNRIFRRASRAGK